LLGGRAFRAPSIYELYYNDDGFTQIPSPDLDPELVYSAELEHTHRFSPTVSARASAYTNYVTDLIVRDSTGESITERVESFNTMYLRLFDAFSRLYDGQYPIMGNAQVMTAKVSWDNATYWAISALLFFQQRYRRPEFISSIDTLLRRFFVLHARMQSFFRAWNEADDNSASGPAALNIVDVDFLRRLQADLAIPHMDDEPLRARLEANLALLEAFARTWQRVAAERQPSLARFVTDADSSPPSLDVNALRISIQLPA
jgi:hypothetical protein